MLRWWRGQCVAFRTLTSNSSLHINQIVSKVIQTTYRRFLSFFSIKLQILSPSGHQCSFNVTFIGTCVKITESNIAKESCGWENWLLCIIVWKIVILANFAITRGKNGPWWVYIGVQRTNTAKVRGLVRIICISIVDWEELWLSMVI